MADSLGGIKIIMEVHHHAHTSQEKNGPIISGSFSCYFLLCFAVFLQNITLEHKIEKDREKQFIKSLVNDIKADVAQLNTALSKKETKKFERLDSVFALINLPDYCGVRQQYLF